MKVNPYIRTTVLLSTLALLSTTPTTPSLHPSAAPFFAHAQAIFSESPSSSPIGDLDDPTSDTPAMLTEEEEYELDASMRESSSKIGVKDLDDILKEV